MTQENKSVELKETYDINLGHWLEKGWKLYWSDAANFTILSLIYTSILAILGTLTAGIGLVFVWGPLNIGFFYLILNKVRNKDYRFDFSELAKGFNYYIPSVLANVIIFTFFIFGFIFCVIPCIIVAAIYLFVYILILEYDMDFWEAMEASRKIVSKHLFEFSIFTLIHFILYLVGITFCFIGIIPVIAFVNCSIVIAYDELVGIHLDKQNNSHNPAQ